MTTLWTHTHTHMKRLCSDEARCIRSSQLRSHPDFGDGLLHRFVVDLPEGDGVKLALVQVGHGAIPRLLTQTLGRLESVLEIIPAKL